MIQCVSEIGYIRLCIIVNKTVWSRCISVLKPHMTNKNKSLANIKIKPNILRFHKIESTRCVTTADIVIQSISNVIERYSSSSDVIC